MNPFKEIILVEKNGRVYQLHWQNRYVPLALLAATAGAQVYQGIAANQEGKAEQSMMNYNAKVKEVEAKQAEMRSLFEQKQEVEAGERRMSTLQAGLGASGVVMTEGSPLLLQAKQASENELASLMPAYEGQITSTRARTEAGLFRTEGKMARQRSKNAMLGSFLGAGGTVLSGYGNYAAGKTAQKQANWNRATSGAESWLNK